MPTGAPNLSVVCSFELRLSSPPLRFSNLFFFPSPGGGLGSGSRPVAALFVYGNNCPCSAKQNVRLRSTLVDRRVSTCARHLLALPSCTRGVVGTGLRVEWVVGGRGRARDRLALDTWNDVWRRVPVVASPCTRALSPFLTGSRTNKVLIAGFTGEHHTTPLQNVVKHSCEYKFMKRDRC